MVFGSNVNTMVPHQSLDLIAGFPDFNQSTGILDDKTPEPNKDLLLFDWRAKLWHSLHLLVVNWMQ